MEHTMTFQLIVRSLPHEDLCLTKLHILLGEDKGVGLTLWHTNLVGSGDTSILIDIVCWFRSFLQQSVQQFYRKLLRILIFRTPSKFVFANGREEHAITLEETSVIHANRVSHTSNTDGLQYTTITKLFGETFSSHQLWLRRIVGL